MPNQRFRFTRAELSGFSVKELKSFLPPGCRYQATDTMDLREYLIRSGAVEVVEPLSTVELSRRHIMQDMSARELKDCMNQAGVYFDPQKVADKEGMLEHFVDSGKLNLLSDSDDSEDEEDHRPPKSSSRARRNSLGSQPRNSEYGSDKSLKSNKQQQKNKPWNPMSFRGNAPGLDATTDRSEDDRDVVREVFDPLFYKEKGNAAMAAGNPLKAVEYYTKGLELDDNAHAKRHHLYYSNRSAAYLELGDAKSALFDANICLKLQPTFAKGYARKGLALKALGRYPEAATTYHAGLKRYPKDATLLLCLEDLERAEARLERQEQARLLEKQSSKRGLFGGLRNSRRRSSCV